MLNVPALRAVKNDTSGRPALIPLIEIEYDAGQWIRWAKYNEDVIFAGNTYSPFPFGGIEIVENAQGELPAWDIQIANAGREMISILEFNEIENKGGRILWVDPLQLGDPTAFIEEKFTIVSAQANEAMATLTCAAISFDPLGVTIPAERVTLAEFPGILGNRGALT